MNRKKYARGTLLFLFLVSMLFCGCLGGGKEGDGPKKSDPPQVAIMPTSISVSVPGNHPQAFRIFNVGGDNNSTDNLVYSVNDNGALGGFLDVQPTFGSLAMGQSQDISVSLKPSLLGAFTNPFRGATLVLNVATPSAVNYINIPVSVNIVEGDPYEGEYAGSWNLTCPVCGDSASGTFTSTVANGVFTDTTTIAIGTHGIRDASGTVSSSGAISATGPAPAIAGCSGSVSMFTGQITLTPSGGAEMTVEYSRPKSGVCEAESGTMTATRQ